MFNPLTHPICFTNLLRISPSTWIGHAPFAMFLINLLKPEVFVELGTYYGTSYCAFCQAVDQLKLATKCYAIDTWEGDSQSGFYGSEVLSELRNYHDRLYGKFSRLIQSTFDKSIAHFEDKSIDLLHIDGFHTYEEVKKDFSKWLPKVSTRGIILFHDINVKERDFGVWKFWEEIKNKYPNFEFIHSHGLGILAVGGNCPKEVINFLNFSNQNPAQIQDFFYQLGLRFEISLEIKMLRETLESQKQEFRKNEENLVVLREALESQKDILNQYQVREQEFRKNEENLVVLNQLKQELSVKSTQLIIKEEEYKEKEKKFGSILQIQQRNIAKEQELLNQKQNINLEKENLQLNLAEIERKAFELDEEKVNVESFHKKLVEENQYFFAKILEFQNLVSATNSQISEGKNVINFLKSKFAETNTVSNNKILKFVIGIVTYNNSEDQIFQLLDSIKIAIENIYELNICFELFVIDNGQETFWSESGLKIAKFKTLGNIGFGRGMNHLMSNAFSDSESQWFLCLNPDGALHYNSLNEIIEISKLNPDSLIEARQFPSEHPKEYDPQTLDTPWASGACLLIPRSIYKKLNGFDPNFFMYMEDIDLSWRARSAGFSVKIAPNALFAHAVTDRNFDLNTEKNFFLSGRYLAHKWKNNEFLGWVEQELIKRGHYSSTIELPQLPNLPDENEMNLSITDFDHYFHFSQARW